MRLKAWKRFAAIALAGTLCLSGASMAWADEPEETTESTESTGAEGSEEAGESTGTEGSEDGDESTGTEGVEEDQEKKNGLYLEDGELNYYVDGEFQSDLTGVVYIDGVGYYIHQGEVAVQTGMVTDGELIYYLRDGVVTGNVIVEDEGTSLYITEEGILDFEYTSVVEVDGVEYFVYKGIVYEMHEHASEGEHTITPATCTEFGTDAYVCDVCGMEVVDEIGATGHENTEIRNRKKATCKEDGYSGDEYCKDCDTLIDEGQVIPKTNNHTWNDGEVVTEATEEETGEMKYTCNLCGETKTEEIPRLPHTHKGAKKVDGVAPTCTEPGTIVYYTCSGCELIFADEDLTEEIDDIVAPATGHLHIEVRDKVKASCGEDGFSGNDYCMDCGELVEKGQIIPATNEHIWNEGTILKEATEDEAGCKEVTCTVCEQIAEVEIPKLPHTHKGAALVEATEPTCTEAGNVTYYSCSGCELIFADEELTEELEDAVIPATGHDKGEVREAVEATCGTDGYTGDTYCTVCDELIAEGEVIPKTEKHSWDEGKIVTPMSFKEDGVKEYTCSTCGEKKTEIIPKEISATGLREVDGKYIYYVNNVRQYTTGIVKLNDGNQYYLVDGVVNGNTVVKTSDGWWYINSDGILDNSANTVAKNSNGWWVIRKGKVDFGYTGFAENDNGWWYCVNGKVAFNVSDVIKDSHAAISGQKDWWYVAGGKVTLVNTVAKNSNGWWKITNGMVDFNYNGVATNSNGTWKIESGKVNFSFQGFAKDGAAWYYLEDGKVQTGRTDVIKGYVNGEQAWWYVNNGKVSFTNTVAKNSNGWWKITDGCVDFNFTGLASNAYGTWYLVKGKVQFDFNGTVYSGGTTFKIVNGKVA